MKTQNDFDLVVDKVAQTVMMTRQFDAKLALVWDAFTKKELLEQWWAPQPFTSRTKVMDFKVGGRRFYAMVSPDGQEGWAVQKYTSISPKTNFKFLNAFADANENMHLPGSDWDFNFIDNGDTTTVTIKIYNESLERMERILASGFREGMAATLKQLEKLVSELKGKG